MSTISPQTEGMLFKSPLHQMQLAFLSWILVLRYVPGIEWLNLLCSPAHKQDVKCILSHWHATKWLIKSPAQIWKQMCNVIFSQNISLFCSSLKWTVSLLEEIILHFSQDRTKIKLQNTMRIHKTITFHSTDTHSTIIKGEKLVCISPRNEWLTIDNESETNQSMRRNNERKQRKRYLRSCTSRKETTIHSF